MRLFIKSARARLMVGAAVGILAASAGSAWAQTQQAITIEPQPLASALYEFGSKTGRQVMFTPSVAAAKRTAGVISGADEQQVLAQLLVGSGLTFRREGDIYMIVQAGEGSDPQSGSAAGDGADQGTVQALIVTAQKREEEIQDVPIAISAFTQKSLEEQKIEGGYDLLKAIPNVTFSKNNFSGYNFSIRGVGTKAISATTDPGVAVSFNNTTLIQNRLFEQEYFDVERVEVLRGPQGTLYGRNATSGVINVISAKPKLDKFEASAKVEVGNYDSRRFVGMLNVPILNDVLGVRLAGAYTKRSGYDYNALTHDAVNGRDLWSGRLTVGFRPMPSLRADLIWEHFNEDDNRSRTGKQLCYRDPGPTTIGNTPVVTSSGVINPEYAARVRPAIFSQGCLPGSLYDDAAFGVPNGIALPFILAPLALGADCGVGCTALFPIGTIGGRPQTFIQARDPYQGTTQSKDLRTISSFRDPIYRANADVVELNLDFDITDSLTFSSQTAYNKDEVYSFQDYNRFNTQPIFTNTSLFPGPAFGGDFRALAPNGVFCDPQLGCSDRMAGFDISSAVGKQFSQEFRLQSDFDGPVNFSVGANYTKFKTQVDYYVMFNVITALALTPPFNRDNNGVIDLNYCGGSKYLNAFGNSGSPVVAGAPNAACPYVDPNPVESINGEGHNYFRSSNPYSLNSKAAFGEVYWNITDALKLTAGLRYTKDHKDFTPVPSQILLAPGFVGGGTVSKGYPELAPIIQEWGEWTGRFGLDWKPNLNFTDKTLLYAFFSHGYKGGGANPPSPGFSNYEENLAQAIAMGAPQFTIDNIIALHQVPLYLTGKEYGPTFKPEFVNAFEFGTKNTLLGGAMTFNSDAFYYDYKDYQVSQIRDRTAVNENFDATIWGLEFETVFAPSRNFRINANLGYLDTAIADGESSIDIMNRTQGNPAYTLVKPGPQLPSNCVVPTPVAEEWLLEHNNDLLYGAICGGSVIVGAPPSRPIDPATGELYDYTNYPELNGGAGLRAQLGGNELPNAPHWTTNVGAQYGRDILDGSWRVTLRGDAYWQSQSWARVYNAVNDKLHGWYNVNVSVRLTNEDLGIEAEFYVKNLLDKSPITDAFLNSDDSALTTNVFVLDPRLTGFSVRKTF